MMAARGNAAKKMNEQKKNDKKRESKMGGDVISEEVRRAHAPLAAHKNRLPALRRS